MNGMNGMAPGTSFAGVSFAGLSVALPSAPS